MFDWLAAGIAVTGVAGALKAGFTAQRAGERAASALKRNAAAAGEAVRKRLKCPPGYHLDEEISSDAASVTVRCKLCGDVRKGMY